jgi:CheY-like chemotaxis protein
MAPAEIHRPNTPRILIVDDDPATRAFCTKILNRAEYSTLAASGSSDAMWLATSSANPFNLLVVDVFLPILPELRLGSIQNVYPPVNGDEMVRLMSATMPELRVLYISSSSRAHLLKEGIDLGSAPFLQKPLEAETFLHWVKTTLEAPPLRLAVPQNATSSPDDHSERSSELAA